MPFEQPGLQPEEKAEENKPKRRGLLRTLAAAGAIAAAGVGLHLASERREQETRERVHNVEVSSDINQDHRESAEIEKFAKERYEFLLQEYYTRINNLNNIKKDERFSSSNSRVNESKARAIKYLVDSGVVKDPDSTGWEYLWHNTSFSGELVPERMEIGNIKAPLEGFYEPAETKILKFYYGEKADDTIDFDRY